MKTKVYLFFITAVAITSIAISAYCLQNLISTKKRAEQAERHAILAQIRIAKAERDIDLLRLNKIVENTVLNNSNRRFQQALAIRNKIHQQVPLQNTPKDFNFLDIDESYLRSLRDKDVGHICGGLSRIYATALESQGIPARLVHMISAVKQPYDGHTSIEFWHDGKWYASDPSFNVMFKKNGQYLSYAELYELVQQGETYEIVSNGFPVVPGRAIEKYIQLEKLLKYMVVQASEVWSEGEKLTYPVKVLPDSWDGVANPDGRKIDYKSFNPIDRYLNKGPLR